MKEEECEEQRLGNELIVLGVIDGLSEVCNDRIFVSVSEFASRLADKKRGFAIDDLILRGAKMMACCIVRF
jgi:hypothetical protein